MHNSQRLPKIHPNNGTASSWFPSDQYDVNKKCDCEFECIAAAATKNQQISLNPI